MTVEDAEGAVQAFSERSGLLNPTVLKAAWLRAVDANENPVQRLISLCDLAEECRYGVGVDSIGHRDLDLIPMSLWRIR
jgi:hypothetical protein